MMKKGGDWGRGRGEGGRGEGGSTGKGKARVRGVKPPLTILQSAKRILNMPKLNHFSIQQSQSDGNWRLIITR